MKTLDLKRRPKTDTIVKRTHLTGIFLLFLGGVLFGMAPSTLAVNEYDCGTYGAGAYNENCPAEASNTQAAAGNGTTLNNEPSYNSSEGETVTLTPSQVIYFSVQGVRYSATVKVITDDTVTVTIESPSTEPTDITLNINKTMNYDANGDGTSDVAMTYLGSNSDNVGSFNFRELSVSNTDKPVTTIESSPYNWWWVWLFIGLIILALIILITVARRKGTRS